MKWEHAKSESENGYHRLSIEADLAELATDYDDIVSQYAKARIQGFRPGKAPRNIIEKRFQKEIIEDLSRRSAHRVGLEAVREAGIEVLGLSRQRRSSAQETRCSATGFVFIPCGQSICLTSPVSRSTTKVLIPATRSPSGFLSW